MISKEEKRLGLGGRGGTPGDTCIDKKWGRGGITITRMAVGNRGNKGIINRSYV